MFFKELSNIKRTLIDNDFLNFLMTANCTKRSPTKKQKNNKKRRIWIAIITLITPLIYLIEINCTLTTNEGNALENVLHVNPKTKQSFNSI